MTFSEGGRFEGGRVRRHGRGAAVAGGGGLIGVVALLVFVLTGQDPSALLGAGGQADGDLSTVAECTAEQANADPLCRYSATLQSLDAFWEADVPAEVAFTPPVGNAFEGGVGTACGQASASTGPFYCPPDQGIYLDVSFFELLQQRFGAQGGPLAEMYIYAHEYGHHVQNLTGVFDAADRSGGGAESDSVRVELQADCYAGMWVGDAATREDPGNPGVTFLDPPTAEELAQALDAAASVGDDHIQEQSGGGVDPDTWTHGSSEQRQRWFTIGYEQGSIEACDTFATDTL